MSRTQTEQRTPGESLELSNDELGTLGQDQFKLLASRSRLIANPPTQDRAGWDFVVEFHPDDTQASTYDARAGVVAAYVQVKTTWRGRKPIVRLTLSAAGLLAKRPGPSFIVAFAIEPDDLEEFDVHVIEMIDRPFADVLKALRQLDVSGRKPNHSEIAFRLTQSNRLTSPTGSALRKRLAAAISGGEDAYIARKKLQRETLGFGPWAHEATLEMHDVTPAETLDLLLGVKDFKGAIKDVRSTRFGITLPSDAIPSGEGVMRLLPHRKAACRARIRAKGLPRPLTFEGWFSHASLPGPSGLFWKSRFGFGDFDVSHTASGFQLHVGEPSDREARPLDEWVKFYRFMATINDTPSALELTVADAVFRWETTPPTDADREARARLDLFETALRLAQELGVASHPVPVRDVFAAQKQIYAAVGFTLRNARSVRVTFTSTRAAGEEFSTDRLYVGMLDLGAHRIAHAVAVELDQSNPDHEAEWTTTRFRDGMLQVIDRTPEAFRGFVQEAKQITGLDSVLLDEIDADFLNQALGECKGF